MWEMFLMLEGLSVKTGKCRDGSHVSQARTSGAA